MLILPRGDRESVTPGPALTAATPDVLTLTAAPTFP